MMKQRIYLIGTLSVMLALLVVGCGSGGDVDGGDAVAIEGLPKNADGYADVTVQQLAELLEQKSFTLVNVHVPYEGEIPQTDLFIPYDEIEASLDQLPDKDAPIVLYCRSGSMSTSAAQDLATLGYANVLELDGGFSAWKAAGYELLDKR